MSELSPRKRLQFDPTINLGHVLTFVGFVATGFGAYATLDRRLAIQEERTSMLSTLQKEQAANIQGRLDEMRSDVKDVQRSVNDLNRTLQQQQRRP